MWEVAPCAKCHKVVLRAPVIFENPIDKSRLYTVCGRILPQSTKAVATAWSFLHMGFQFLPVPYQTRLFARGREVKPQDRRTIVMDEEGAVTTEFPLAAVLK